MGQVVALWGAPGSGKTAISVKLAQLVCGQGCRVLLLLADRIAPPLPTLAGGQRLTNLRSLGSVLAAASPTPALVRFHLAGVESQPQLSILGLLKGENPRSYPEPDVSQAAQLLAAASTLADLALVDCGSALAWDALSLAAVEQAGLSLCLMAPELKSVNYLSSQLSLVSQHQDQRRLRLLNHVNADVTVAAAAFRDADRSLPYCRELAQQSALGELLRPLTHKASRHFERELSALAEDILTQKGGNDKK